MRQCQLDFSRRIHFKRSDKALEFLCGLAGCQLICQLLVVCNVAEVVDLVVVFGMLQTEGVKVAKGDCFLVLGLDLCAIEVVKLNDLLAPRSILPFAPSALPSFARASYALRALFSCERSADTLSRTFLSLDACISSRPSVLST